MIAPLRRIDPGPLAARPTRVMERSPWEPEGVDIVLGPAGTLAREDAMEGIDIHALFRRLVIARHADKLFSGLNLPLWASGAGEEAALAAAAQLLDDEDWAYIGARDLSFPLLRGATLSSVVSQLRGDPNSETRGRLGCRGVATHEYCVAPPSEALGMHLPIAAGQARAQRLTRSGAVTLALCGEGLTTHGLFHESLALAVSDDLPLLVVVKSRVWPNAAPPEAGLLGESVCERARAAGVWSRRTDGADPISVYGELAQALEHIRDGQGPALVEVVVTRLDACVPPQRDPLHRLRRFLEERDELAGIDESSLLEQLDAEFSDALLTPIEGTTK